KPFKCAICDQAFTRNCDLDRHVRSHLGQKPHPCPFCGKKFSRADVLKRHM
ncbi:hypothetical protein GQ42DRAFT_109085, partial [Ramicandelaber brevisporus]